MLERPLPETVRELKDAARRPAADSSPYVLVVDDEAVVRDFLERCLQGSGYAVSKASSAAEALELMVERPASVVLCDIRMPGQDGLWLASRLRAHWPDTQIVMVTAVDDVETVRQSRELGAVDFLTKPIKPELVLQVVRQRSTNRVEKEKPTAIEEETAAPAEERQMLQETNIEAEYTLEHPVRCPACGERIAALKAVRLVRTHVNFTSTLPRRGRVMACPNCLAVIPAELTNF